MFKKTTRFTAAVAGLIFAGSASAALLSVDFDETTATEPGFSSFAEADKPSKAFSGITVTISGEQALVGGFHDRGAMADNAAFTYGDLYREFFFHNEGGTLSVDLSGLAADTDYDITWYMFDSHPDGDGGATIQADPGSSTTGDTVAAAWTSASPTTNDQYAFSGTWTSTNGGTLEIDFVPTGQRVRINGFELSEVPEPSSLALLGLGGLLIARRRRG